MGQRGSALLAVITGLIALIAAAVLVYHPFERPSPPPQEQESTDVGEMPSPATQTTATSPPRTTTTTPEKNDESTTESEYPAPGSPSSPELPESREAIPNGMVDGDCEATSDGATECPAPEGHVVTATPFSGGVIGCNGCSNITDEVDEPLLFALLVPDQNAPYILWVSQEHADFQLRVDAAPGEDHRSLIEWWSDYL